jgi:hypothetical protein
MGWHVGGGREMRPRNRTPLSPRKNGKTVMAKLLWILHPDVPTARSRYAPEVVRSGPCIRYNWKSWWGRQAVSRERCIGVCNVIVLADGYLCHVLVLLECICAADQRNGSGCL